MLKERNGEYMQYSNSNYPNLNLKPLTDTELYKLGLPRDYFAKIETLEELKKTNQNIIVAKCKNTTRFYQNNSSVQEVIKNKQYVMSLSVYQQLRYDLKNKIDILEPSAIQFKNVYHPYNGEDLNNKTLLVSRTGGIGDLLFISPNLRYLKEKYPSSKIIFSCSPQYYSMIKEWEFVDEIIDLPFNLSYLFKTNYHAFFEGVIERCKEAENICSYNLFSKWLGLNLSDDLLIPKQTPNQEKIQNCLKILEEFGFKEKDFIIIQIRSSTPIRTPRHDIWKKIINSLTTSGNRVIITDSSISGRMIDLFIKSLENQDMVKNFSYHSKEISDTIAMASLAKLGIGPDSSLNHIAASVGTKTFGIFGAFPGEIRFSTYPKKLCDYINADYKCSPCFLHTSSACSNVFNHFVPCYDAINYEETMKKIEKLLDVQK